MYTRGATSNETEEGLVRRNTGNSIMRLQQVVYDHDCNFSKVNFVFAVFCFVFFKPLFSSLRATLENFFFFFCGDSSPALRCALITKIRLS